MTSDCYILIPRKCPRKTPFKTQWRAPPLLRHHYHILNKNLIDMRVIDFTCIVSTANKTQVSTKICCNLGSVRVNHLQSDLMPYLSRSTFCNSPAWNIEFDDPDFYFFSKLNFTGYNRQKTLFQTWKKSSPSNSIFQSGQLQKSSADR